MERLAPTGLLPGRSVARQKDGDAPDDEESEDDGPAQQDEHDGHAPAQYRGPGRIRPATCPVVPRARIRLCRFARCVSKSTDERRPRNRQPRCQRYPRRLVVLGGEERLPAVLLAQLGIDTVAARRCTCMCRHGCGGQQRQHADHPHALHSNPPVPFAEYGLPTLLEDCSAPTGGGRVDQGRFLCALSAGA